MFESKYELPSSTSMWSTAQQVRGARLAVADHVLRTVASDQQHDACRDLLEAVGLAADECQGYYRSLGGQTVGCTEDAVYPTEFCEDHQPTIEYDDSDDQWNRRHES